MGDVEHIQAQKNMQTYNLPVLVITKDSVKMTFSYSKR